MAELNYIQSSKKDVDFNIFVVLCVILSWVLILFIHGRVLVRYLKQTLKV